MSCVVSQNGDLWTIDEAHEAYPRYRKAGPSATPENGAGTHLKKFFWKWFGQKASPTCSCNAVAERMDRMGPQWCRENMEWILGEVQKNAEKRGLPFIKAVVEPIVLLAIRKAERDQRQGE